MAVCEVCGNDYYLSFDVITGGNKHTFDSFECAIHKLAPVCAHCECRIIGHGVEAGGTFFCCTSCARMAGVDGVADHAPTEKPVRTERGNLEMGAAETFGGHLS